MPEFAALPLFLPFIMAGLAGALVGLGYFYGLWWSLRAMIGRNRPRQFFFLAYLARLALALAGFWAVLRLAGPWGLGLALVAFTLVRVVLSRTLGRPSGATRGPATQGAPRADQP